LSTYRTNEIGPVQRQALLSSFAGWMFDGFETSTFILVGNAAALSLLPDSTSEKIRIAVGSGLASTLLGWAIGGTVGSVMADFVGRKKMLMISIAGYCAFTALTAFSGSMTMLIVLRFLTGMFLGAEWSTGTVLVAETWPASARAKALGIMQSGYGFGFLLATGLWLLVRPCGGAEGWRWMFTVGVVPGLLLIYIRRKAPESQLWLEAVSRDQEKTEAQLRCTIREPSRGDIRFRCARHCGGHGVRVLRNQRFYRSVYRCDGGSAGFDG
jgi:MFS family permease